MISLRYRLLPFHLASCRRKVSAIMNNQNKRRTSGSSSSEGPASPTGSPTPVGHDTMMSLCRSIIMPLSYSRHKGEAGQIGVIGGCEQYTGAPYFAALTAMKVGGDLAHVICTGGASTPIKSYSPELIVHPLLDRSTAVDEVSKLLPRLHTIVVGPGLGRDEQNLATAKAIVLRAKRMRIPIVMDANGIDLVVADTSIVKGYSRVILTPNAAEFNRLYQQLMGQKPEEGNDVAATIELSRALENVTIVRKGNSDIICTGDKVVTCSVEGSPRRCGGQGDILSGAMGTFLHWAYNAYKTTDSYVMKSQGPNMSAAYMACALTREVNRRTFYKHRRATTTTDMLEEVGPGFRTLYEPKA